MILSYKGGPLDGMDMEYWDHDHEFKNGSKLESEEMKGWYHLYDEDGDYIGFRQWPRSKND